MKEDDYIRSYDPNFEAVFHFGKPLYGSVSDNLERGRDAFLRAYKELKEKRLLVKNLEDYRDLSIEMNHMLRNAELCAEYANRYSSLDNNFVINVRHDDFLEEQDKERMQINLKIDELLKYGYEGVRFDSEIDAIKHIEVKMNPYLKERVGWNVDVDKVRADHLAIFNDNERLMEGVLLKHKEDMEKAGVQ